MQYLPTMGLELRKFTNKAGRPRNIKRCKNPGGEKKEKSRANAVNEKLPTTSPRTLYGMKDVRIFFLNGQKERYKPMHYTGRTKVLSQRRPRRLSREARTWTGSWGGQDTPVATPEGRHLSTPSRVSKHYPSEAVLLGPIALFSITASPG